MWWLGGVNVVEQIELRIWNAFAKSFDIWITHAIWRDVLSERLKEDWRENLIYKYYYLLKEEREAMYGGSYEKEST